jgi:hypothetical protein
VLKSIAFKLKLPLFSNYKLNSILRSLALEVFENSQGSADYLAVMDELQHLLDLLLDAAVLHQISCDVAGDSAVSGQQNKANFEGVVAVIGSFSQLINKLLEKSQLTPDLCDGVTLN